MALVRSHLEVYKSRYQIKLKFGCVALKFHLLCRIAHCDIVLLHFSFSKYLLRGHSSIDLQEMSYSELKTGRRSSIVDVNDYRATSTKNSTSPRKPSHFLIPSSGYVGSELPCLETEHTNPSYLTTALIWFYHHSELQRDAIVSMIRLRTGALGDVFRAVYKSKYVRLFCLNTLSRHIHSRNVAFQDLTMDFDLRCIFCKLSLADLR